MLAELFGVQRQLKMQQDPVDDVLLGARRTPRSGAESTAIRSLVEGDDGARAKND
jgi:hypothetical protein